MPKVVRLTSTTLTFIPLDYENKEYLPNIRDALLLCDGFR